jgi:hypothetical protein
MATYFNTNDLKARMTKTAMWIADEGHRLAKKAKYEGRVPPCCMSNLEYVVAALEALECYTPVTTLTGTATTTSTTALIDSSATFVTDGVETGDFVENTTTSESYEITAIVSETELTINLDGDTFTSGDAYELPVDNNCLTETQAENLFDNISKITGLGFVPKGTNYETITEDDNNQTVTTNSGGGIPLNGGGTLEAELQDSESAS